MKGEYYEWDKYEDLYVQLPLDIVVNARSDAEELINTGAGCGSFHIKDRTTGESCWIDVTVDVMGLSWEFNQYIFGIKNSEDIQARRFQDRIVNNSDYDIGCEIEDYIDKCNAHIKSLQEEHDKDITDD